MGIGDCIMALGHFTKNLGDEVKIIMDGKSAYKSPIFKHNPRIVVLGTQGAHYFNWNKLKNKGAFYQKKGYKEWGRKYGNWIYQPYFPVAGSIYFRQFELDGAKKELESRNIDKFIYLNPMIKEPNQCNKQWGINNYNKLIEISDDSLKFVTCIPVSSDDKLNKLYSEISDNLSSDIIQIKTKNVREALSILSHADLYVGNEGGMHHAAAALNLAGIVIRGHCVHPSITGYDIHTNYFYEDGTEKNKYGCGIYGRECEKCTYAMNKVFTPDIIYEEVLKLLKTKTEKKILVNPDGNYGYMSEDI